MRLIFSTASLADATAVVLLQKLESNRLGFLPAAALHEYIRCGWCLVARCDGAPIGYLLGRPSLRYDRLIRPITQLVVIHAFRRMRVASALVEELSRRALVHRQHALQAWTRDDLPAASALWRSLQWTAVATRAPRTARDKPATLWRKCLTAVPHAGFYKLPPVGGFRAAHTTAVAVTH